MKILLPIAPVSVSLVLVFYLLRLHDPFVQGTSAAGVISRGKTEGDIHLAKSAWISLTVKASPLSSIVRSLSR